MKIFTRIHEIIDWYFYKFILSQKKIIFNKFGKKGPVLLHYKTDAYVPKIFNFDWRHSNRQEIKAIIDTLVLFDYKVTLVDIRNKTFKPKDDYSLFIGLASGNTGSKFCDFSEMIPSAKKIAYCSGPDPILSNKLVQRVYDQHNFIMGRNDPGMRLITKIDFEKTNKYLDGIIVIGEKKQFSYNSYLKYNKPIFSIKPSFNSSVNFNPDWYKTKKLNNFICFAGSGFICKGVHLVLKAFIDNPSLTLHICGPLDEPSFWEAYSDKIRTAKNIHFHGLIKPGSKKFNNLLKVCAFSILYSAAEGCATSVLNVMAAGAVPIVNHRTGLNTNKFPFLLIDDIKHPVNHISKIIKTASKMSCSNYFNSLNIALNYSVDFNINNFKTQVSEILIQLEKNEN